MRGKESAAMGNLWPSRFSWIVENRGRSGNFLVVDKILSISYFNFLLSQLMSDPAKDNLAPLKDYNQGSDKNTSDLKKLACLCGLLLSGLVFLHLFQWEVASPLESVIVTIIIILASFALGFLFGYIRPELSFRWGILLTIPAFSILVFPLFLAFIYFFVSFLDFTILEAIYFLTRYFLKWLILSSVLSIFFACTGAYLGALINLKRVAKVN